MTKKQIILLSSLALLGFTTIALFGAWKIKPFNADNEILPTNTSEFQNDGSKHNESSIDDNPDTSSGSFSEQWPTITPRALSASTPTPAPLEYEQLPMMLQGEAATITPILEETREITLTSTIAPSKTSDSVEISIIAEDQSPFSIGVSVQGEDLLVYKFGHGQVEKLIVAGIHGGYEYNTTNLAYELITYIQTYPETIPEDTTLYILPSFNPDGLIRSFGYAGRANANNVDLNRNWDFNWKSTWNPAGCWAYLPIVGGEAPFSEPETAALRDFILSHEIAALISYHSAALGVFPGGAPDIDISYDLAETIAQVVPYPYPPLQTGCETTGQFVDYASSYGIPALDVELTNHKDSDFDINLEVLKAFLAWSK